MPIQSLSQKDFDKFEPARSPILALAIDEVEWFADEERIVLGVLALDKSDKDWSVAVLGRDERGQFRAIDMETSIENKDDARTNLMTKMNKALATGDKVFPQGD